MSTFSFSVGERVRVREGDPSGHIRTPFYLRGKIGIVEKLHGIFKDPEKLAYGKPGLPRQPLYLVSFRQSDVWPQYKGGVADSVMADIYEHWLELDKK